MIRSLVRFWHRMELRHIEDAIEDELERERKHPRTMRNLYALRAGILWNIKRGPDLHSGVSAWPKESK